MFGYVQSHRVVVVCKLCPCVVYGDTSALDESLRTWRTGLAVVLGCKCNVPTSLLKNKTRNIVVTEHSL